VKKNGGTARPVRIPASVMQATRLDLDEVVDVARRGAGRIVIETGSAKKHMSWTSWLKGITSKKSTPERLSSARPLATEA